MPDRFNLDWFVDAQRSEYESARLELQQGCKRGHWMWFIFPQFKGLGRSSTANYFGISSRAEAEAYLEHPILGQRLVECTRIVNSIQGSTAAAIFGGIDTLKFRSSMTLFAEIGPNRDVFVGALQKYFGSERDQLTLKLIAQGEETSSP